MRFRAASGLMNSSPNRFLSSPSITDLPLGTDNPGTSAEGTRKTTTVSTHNFTLPNNQWPCSLLLSGSVHVGNSNVSHPQKSYSAPSAKLKSARLVASHPHYAWWIPKPRLSGSVPFPAFSLLRISLINESSGQAPLSLGPSPASHLERSEDFPAPRSVSSAPSSQTSGC